MVRDEGEFGGAWTYAISTVNEDDEDAIDQSLYQIQVTHRGERGNVLDTLFVSSFNGLEAARQFVGLLSHELPRGGNFQRLLRTVNAPDAKAYSNDTMLLFTWSVGVNSR